MKNKWLIKNSERLDNKLVAIIGSTGDILSKVSLHLASLGANLLFINRNKNKSQKLIKEILNKYDIKIYEVYLDLENFTSVKKEINNIINYKIDYLILAGASYKIARRISDIGYDNVFTINFISQYYIAKKVMEKMEENKNGKVIVVSSIAYNYSKIKINDIDFKDNKHSNKVYGNSKRFLMFTLQEEIKNYKYVKLSLTHPGIAYTNITSHYPKWLLYIIDIPMKLIFNRKEKASFSIIKGLFMDTKYLEWIGPRVFNIWGYPNVKKIKNIKKDEIKKIYSISESIYNEINK